MPTVAICYWGLTRSTKKVYTSHHKRLFDILTCNNCTYDTFMHTWATEDNRIWGVKSNSPIDYEEYKLLSPNYFQRDNQDEFLYTLNISDYFNKSLYSKYGGNTHHEWHPILIRNHLCALESQKRVTNMVLNNPTKYDHVVYIRPDVFINDDFKMAFLQPKTNNISIPDREHNEGYNDKLAIVDYDKCGLYGRRIDEIIEFRRTHGRIVSEKFVKYIIDKHFESVTFIKFDFDIIRP